jgi:hypothetical protein
MKQTLPRSATTVALFFLVISLAAAQPAVAQTTANDVMKIDEAYRLAKLNRDIKALDRILADGFNETNQNGNSRDKAQMIELWKSFSIGSLTTDTHQVRVAGGTATVIGRQTENGTERMLFTRVYVNGPTGWQLLASTQFRDPDLASSAIATWRQETGQSSGESEVTKADEEYRLAKLNRDVKALDRILADGFNETNQNGNSRNKAQTIDLWKSFSIDSLTTDTHQVRVDRDTATVTGTQTEDGTERMLFTRVYVNGPLGWQLLASMQFRNPNAGGLADTRR